MNNLKTTKLNKLMKKLEEVGDAYIEVALMNIPLNQQKQKEIDLPTCLSSIRNCNELAVVTSYIPIDPSCKYDQLITIQKFGKKFKLVGGLNLPKLTQCFGSDGNLYPQLIKGLVFFLILF